MIEEMEDLPDGCIGMRAIGQFTTDDFAATIQPRVDAVVEGNTELRLVLQLGEQFEGFGEGAWGELTAGIRKIHFHRGAVVTDERFISSGINVLKWTLRGHVRTFHNRELDAAIRWVSG